MKAFKLIQIVAFLGLIGVCLSLFSLRPTLQLEAPGIEVRSHAFDDATAEYAERATAVFEMANRKRQELNQTGRWCQTVSQAAAWLAFIFTTAITAMATFFSPGTDLQQSNTADGLRKLQKRLKKYAWIIGVLASVSAVSTAIADRAQAEASRRYACANEMMQVVHETRLRLVDQQPRPEKAVADGLLDALENRISQQCFASGR